MWKRIMWSSIRSGPPSPQPVARSTAAQIVFFSVSAGAALDPLGKISKQTFARTRATKACPLSRSSICQFGWHKRFSTGSKQPSVNCDEQEGTLMRTCASNSGVLATLHKQAVSAWGFLWAPFWHRLSFPITGSAFFVTLVDTALYQVLPGCVLYLSGAAFLGCLLDMSKSFRRQPVSRKVAFDDGHGRMGIAGGEALVSWTCAAMRGWRPTMEDSHLATVWAANSQSAASGADVKEQSVQQASDDKPCADVGLFAVFDGHGGWQVADMAQYLMHKMLLQRWSAASDSSRSTDWGEVLTETVLEVDRTLLAGPFCVGKLMDGSVWHPFHRTGSTSCLALVDAGRKVIVVANTGDSRAIFCRSDGTAVDLSTDHKPEDPVESARIHRAGGRVTRGMACFRIDGSLNLSRALGDFHLKSNRSLPANEQKVIPDPAIVIHEWDPSADDEFLLVACDGVFERLTNQGAVDCVRSALSAGLTPRDALQGLLHAACARTPFEPGQDNETAILVQWRVPSSAPPVSNDARFSEDVPLYAPSQA